MVSRLFVIILAATLCGSTIHAQTKAPAAPAAPSTGFLLLDIAGNGYKLTTSEAGVKFDVNGDGKLEQVAWTTAGTDDAFLAIDLNHNGKIDNGTELLGTYFSKADGVRAANGLEALLDLHKHSGVTKFSNIDSTSPLYTQLLVWVDANHNGISEPQELRTLAEAGVVELRLNYTTINDAPDAGGNRVLLKAQAMVRNRSMAPVSGGLDKSPVFLRDLSHIDLSLQK
jgi:hypothetical protein